MFIEADYKVIYLSMSMVIAANIFVLINIFIKHSQIKWLLITFRKYFGWILSSVLVICFCINFEKIMLYPTTLIHIGYIPSDIGNFKIIYTITAAILVIATALMFSRFNVIGKLYSLYFFALIFIAQFFVNIYQFHYIILIWLFPLITGLPLLGSLFNRFRLGIWAATSLLLISILLNSQFLWNYLTHMKFGKERLVNLDDFIEMFAQLPENAYVDPGEDLEYVLAHKYVIEELLIKKLDSTPYCSLKGYIVQPKYLPASGYTTVKSAFTGFNKLQIIKENESYKLYYYEN